MTAIGMLVTSAWRRYWRASLFLAIVAGLAAGIVGASFQAAARAETSVARFTERSRVYDQFVNGCPPGVDPEKIQSVSDGLRLCGNPTIAARFRTVLDHVSGVERTSLASVLVVAVLDPSVSNHWGRLSLLEAALTPHSQPPHGRPIIVEGRLFDPGAPDEIVLGEQAARVAGKHAGDTVRMSGWRQADLDAGIDGTIKPQIRPFAAKIVGVVRYLEDVQPDDQSDLSDAVLPGNIYAGPAWFRAHGSEIAGYGSGVAVRLRGGPRAVKAFQTEMSRAPEGWRSQTTGVGDVSLTSLKRVIRLQRNALLIFAAIAIASSVGFVGLAALRQLRRESAESERLAAMGMTSRQLRALNVVRSLTVAIPACLLATVAIIALSPLGPLGLARELEFDSGVRFDAAVVAATLLATIALFAFTALIAPTEAHARRGARAGRPTSRLDPALRGMGPVAVVGATVARGRSSRAAVGVTAVALAAALAAGGIVASYDWLVAKPSRYGAWWDVVVGQYSERAPLDAGIAKLRTNPAVVAAAGYADQPDLAKIDGRSTRLVAATTYIGHEQPIITSGRAPVAADEIAVGQSMHKHIRDNVTLVTDSRRVHVRVVGIVVINDPITTQSGAGDGAFVTQAGMDRIAGSNGLPQSIAIKLDPHLDRASAIESVRRDFSGSIRSAAPQVDVRNLGLLRAVPWLISALVGILALATLVHALVIILVRNRTNLAVLAALGFTRRQRRGVGVFASVALVITGIAIAIPVGLVVGNQIWRGVTRQIGLPSRTEVAWATLVAAPICALALAAFVALVATRRTARMSPSEQLHVE